MAAFEESVTNPEMELRCANCQWRAAGNRPNKSGNTSDSKTTKPRLRNIWHSSQKSFESFQNKPRTNFYAHQFTDVKRPKTFIRPRWRSGSQESPTGHSSAPSTAACRADHFDMPP